MNKKEIFKSIPLESADLHTHTYYSDGLLSVKDLLTFSSNRGIKTLSITDHDGIRALREARSLAKNYDISLISGIEFSTVYKGEKELHILGYLFDPENETMKDTVKWVLRQREERNGKLFSLMKEEGLDISEKDFEGVSYKDYVGKPIIADKLMEKGYIKERREAFTEGRYFDSASWQGVKKERLKTEEAVKRIKDAGGLSFLAHPSKIRGLGERESEEFLCNLKDLLTDLKADGLMGLECYYPHHTLKETGDFLKLSLELDLLVSRGSDFHGNRKDKTTDWFGRIWEES